MSAETDLLVDILSVLREIRDTLRASGGRAAPSSDARPAASASSKGGQIASDRELDSEWGDPAVRKDPKRWEGPSFAGCHFSECPADYLDELAGLFDWMADKDEESGNMTKGDKPKPTAPYKRRDAARARGWAKRIREGWKPSAPSADDPPPNDDYSAEVPDIPF